MSFNRGQQIEFAKNILRIDEVIGDVSPEVTKKISQLATQFMLESDNDDNGVAFDLSEYLYEKVRNFDSKSDGWQEYALKSLKGQLNDED